MFFNCLRILIFAAEQSSSRLRQTTVNINQLSICSSKLSDRQLCAGILGPNVHDSCQVDYNFLSIYSLRKIWNKE